MRNWDRSQELFEEARRCIPGGVNSPARAFRSVPVSPIFMERGRGAYIYDADGNGYIDYVLSWGPLILGHAHSDVVATIQSRARLGTGFGTPTELETELARVIIDAVPSVEQLRLVSSGTEATMSALRLARAYTQREVIVKFDGCYHGHVDALLIKAGSGALTHGEPTSPGVPKAAAEATRTCPYNDLESLEALFEAEGEQIAAVILEPVAGNMGCVPPREGFLEGVRAITERFGSLLIFDEVMTGFRVAWGGAQTLYGVTPDLTCLGKVIGGGLPVGAFGGRSEIMELLSPQGAVYQAGTLSGNPLAVAAGHETLALLSEPGVYDRLSKHTEELSWGLLRAAENAGVPVYATRVGSMFTIFFSRDPVYDLTGASASNTERFGRFFVEMLRRGVYLAPSQFESAFLSTAHSEGEIEQTIAAAEESFREL